MDYTINFYSWKVFKPITQMRDITSRIYYTLLNHDTNNLIICLYLSPQASAYENTLSDHSSQSQHHTSQSFLSDSHSPAPILKYTADSEQTYIYQIYLL